MDEITLQYIAGLFDGEGSIGIYYRIKGKEGFHLRTQFVQNKDKKTQQLMNYLASKFGGNVSEQITLSGKLKYNWQLNADKAVVFLREIEPFLIFKKEQAVIAINWQAQRPERTRDKKGRIQVKRKRTVDFDVKVSRLIKELKTEDLDIILEDQEDLIEIVKELMPMAINQVAKLLPLAVIKGE